MCGIVKRACIYIFLMLVGIAHTYAISVPEQEWSVAPTMRSQQILTTGVTYNGTIYTPFDNTTPSEVGGIGASYAPGGPLKAPISGEGGDWEEIPDYNHTELSPIGEPWIMALFAILFAGVIAWKKHNKELDRNNI